MSNPLVPIKNPLGIENVKAVIDISAVIRGSIKSALEDKKVTLLEGVAIGQDLLPVVLRLRGGFVNTLVAELKDIVDSERVYLVAYVVEKHNVEPSKAGRFITSGIDWFIHTWQFGNDAIDYYKKEDSGEDFEEVSN